jgi:biopolymer transport protein ExbD
MALGRKGMETVADINVTPMVDVMLVLLIIFMVITPMLQKGVSVEMAKVRNPQKLPDAEKEDALMVAITRDGTIYLQVPTGMERVKAEDLTPRLRDVLTNRVDKTVYVRSDARAKYQGVVDVVDNVRAAGVDQVGLMTDKVQEKVETAGSSGGGD